ncbi:hypothetical protein [Variovorax gossypii]
MPQSDASRGYLEGYRNAGLGVRENQLRTPLRGGWGNRIFGVGSPSSAADRQQFCDEHPGHYLLAFVYGYLGDHGLLRVRTDAEKYLLLAALNLAEHIAFVEFTTTS